MLEWEEKGAWQKDNWISGELSGNVDLHIHILLYLNLFNENN